MCIQSHKHLFYGSACFKKKKHHTWTNSSPTQCCGWVSWISFVISEMGEFHCQVPGPRLKAVTAFIWRAVPIRWKDNIFRWIIMGKLTLGMRDFMDSRTASFLKDANFKQGMSRGPGIWGVGRYPGIRWLSHTQHTLCRTHKSSIHLEFVRRLITLHTFPVYPGALCQKYK